MSPNVPGGKSLVWAHYSSDSKVAVLYLISQSAMQDRWIIKESKSGKSFWKTDFLERSAKHGLLCQIQSRHLNILFWGNLGNSDSCRRPRVRHHQSCLGSGTWVRLGKVTSWAPPVARSKIGLHKPWYRVLKILCILIPVISLDLLCDAHNIQV